MKALCFVASVVLCYAALTMLLPPLLGGYARLVMMLG